MHVAFVTSEMVPYVKTGGLADVSAALPKALVKLGPSGHGASCRATGRSRFRRASSRAPCTCRWTRSSRSAGFYRTRATDGVEVVFVEHPPFFDRRRALRRLRRQPPALRLPRARGPRVLPEPRRAARRLPRPRLADRPRARLPEGLLLGRSDPLPVAQRLHHPQRGLPGHLRPRHASTGSACPGTSAPQSGLEFHGNVSYLKGGVLFSELVNTVSPTYAREIQGPEHGFGFDGVLRGARRTISRGS